MNASFVLYIERRDRMSTPNYSRWYRVGTASVTYNSKNVTGKDTYWLSSGLLPGDMFSTDNGDSFYEIDSITDNTHLTLKSVYRQTTDSASAYSITRNFTATLPAQVAAQTTDLLLDMRRYLDNDTQTLKGKSAYEIACARGYVGTESQWLDSLIGAGKWNELDARTEILSGTYEREAHLNSLVRGKNLGASITAAQLSAIRAGTYDGLMLGDYWTLSCPPLETVRATIVDFGYYRYVGTYVYPDNGEIALGYTPQGVKKPHIVLLLTGNRTGNDFHTGLRGGEINNGASVLMNDTATTAGGFVGTKMYTETLPQVLEWISATIGETNILYHLERLSNAVTDGKASGWVYKYDSKICIPSLWQWTGIEDIGDGGNRVAVGAGQFSLFRVYGGALRWYQASFWARDVMSATDFGQLTPIMAYQSLTANCGYQLGSWGGLAPYIVIG